MRLYQTLDEALSEIQRDLYKGPKITSTRVQQRVGKDLPGRELLGYSYTLETAGIPYDIDELISLGQRFKMEPFLHEDKMKSWLNTELRIRCLGQIDILNETKHPALATTIEGSWPAYTYGERMMGAQYALKHALETSPDSRRAFWPIFRPEDSLRAGAPTRIPCSLGYQLLIRNTPDGQKTILVYLQRSADFDTFFLTDIWLAYRFQDYVSSHLDVPTGQFMHFITSLHSFTVEGTEIY